MADETSVGGIVAPVQADITDFMKKFDQVNEKTNVVSQNVINRLEMVSRALHDVGAQGSDLKLPTTNTSELSRTLQMTDGIKQAKQQIAAIDRNLFEQLQKNNGIETVRTSELRRQKTEIEGQLGAIKTQKEAHDSVGKSISSNNQFLESMKGHLTWMATGGAIAAMFALPAETINRLKELDQAMASVKQVLPDLEHDQNKANTELTNFTKIAAKYGESTLEIADATRSWGRMYKDVDTVNLLVSQSAKMATADNFSMKDSVKGLESAMSQYGMKSEKINEVQANSNRILDVWTKLAHTGGASAQDLVSGVERAGSSAHQAGLSFEFFNAMIATGVRNTALSGAEIGNSMKSLFINIKTDKAIGELDKFGIKMKQTNADGTQSFRNTQDVLLELAMAVQTTDKDTSKLFTTLFGKFQNSKLTSIITDYKQVVDNWQNAVNSSNFTDAQVAVQMDTISRKMGTTRALLDTLVAGSSNSGLATFIKEQIQSINNFLTGLQSISSNMYGVIGTTVKWSVELYALTKVFSSVTAAMGAINIAVKASAAIKSVDTVETVINTEAKIAENIATANLNRTVAIGNAIRGNIIPLLILGTAAMYSYSESVGETNNKIQKQGEIESTKFEKMQRDSENIKQQGEFITALASAYDKQSESLIAVGENTEKGAKIQEEMTFLEKKLTDELNINSDANDQNSGNIIENGKVNRDVIDRNLKAKELHSAELARALLQDADNLRADATNNKNWANAKIVNMENEIKMLGILERAYLGYLNFMAGVYNKMADYQEQAANEEDQYPGVSVPKTDEQKQAHLSSANSYREKANGYKQQRTNTYADYIGASQALRNANEEELLAVKIQSDFVAKNTDSSGTITDKTTKPKKEKAVPGENMRAPDDRTQKFQDKALSMAANKEFDEAKIRADKYAISLDILNSKESLLGVTTESSAQRQKIMNEQINDLVASAMSYEDTANDYEKQANDIIAANSTLKDSLDAQKLSWSGMTKEQKLAFIEANKDYINDVNSMNNLIDLADKFRLKSSESSKQASSTATNALQKDIADAKAIYSNKIQSNDLDKEISVLGLGNNYKKEQADLFELTAAVKNQTEAQTELKRIGNLPSGKASLQYKEQLVIVGQLTNKVDALKDKTLALRQAGATFLDGYMRGTTTFKDFWKNALLDMTTESINAIMKINTTGGSTSLLGKFYNMLTGSNSSSGISKAENTEIDKAMAGITPRASGGPVTAGQTYLVGEKRPELFVPNSNGSIIPDLSMARGNNSNSSNTSNTSGVTTNTTSIAFNPTFVSPDPAANMKAFKQQMPMMKSEIIKLLKTDPAMRNAVKAAT